VTIEYAPEFARRRERLLYDVPEACALTGLSRSRLYLEMTSGRLKFVKVGSRRMLKAIDLQAFVDSLSAVA
jgi:excisionase family DNA binding protein